MSVVSSQRLTHTTQEQETRNAVHSTQPRLTPHASHTLTTLTLRPQRARQIPPTLTHCEPLDDFRHLRTRSGRLSEAKPRRASSWPRCPGRSRQIQKDAAATPDDKLNALFRALRAASTGPPLDVSERVAPLTRARCQCKTRVARRCCRSAPAHAHRTIGRRCQHTQNKRKRRYRGACP